MTSCIIGVNSLKTTSRRNVSAMLTFFMITVSPDEKQFKFVNRSPVSSKQLRTRRLNKFPESSNSKKEDLRTTF